MDWAERSCPLSHRVADCRGYEPVLIGGLAMGRSLMPVTQLADEHSPEEIRQIAAKLKVE
jgi:hypothetical protein